ncbi:hypothetical protein [Litoreibacter roseus]|uniref:Arginine transporter n=1 Tax=Litoreibacter roseus TaxID=2601869 RepID=A0A6N6JBN4_9RHOB|nr:hypothetical protein [Litoreibacter roseus]GFE63474.1 hypothetical protein KIN_05480 [Litoreibacter roseus]
MGRTLILLTTVLGLSAGMGMAGSIERACMKSDRSAKSRYLCNCVQQVADITLSRQDQKLAASFFSDPHQAQVVRQSDRPRDEAFWQRYKGFAGSAQSYCRTRRR